MSNNAPHTKDKYDVFVSFRGEDIRDGFLSHLAEAFRRKKINAFVDDKLQRGEEIWPSLVGAIEGSLVSLIIFSENYASSRWCLNELVKILECRGKYEQIVVPVFYGVDPTDVRHQTGSYETAFLEHGKYFDPTMLKIWSDALNKSADLSGIKSSDSQNDAELLDNITNDVLHQLSRLSKHTLNSKGLVGIGKSFADVEALLLKDSKDVRIIGIWGMGGIGKTTIAEQVFNKICSEYEGSCFLSNVREDSTRHGIIYLKEKLFSTLLAEDVKMKSPNGLSDDIGRRISRMKVLIVLDDVNDSDQLELFGTVDTFGPGSRIIVTTRDQQVLIANKVDDILHVGELSSSESLELFNLIALNHSHLVREYYELTKRVVKYANGIPLVLKVLGHLLCGRDQKAWESQLDKLMEMPSKKVYDVMILSYDDLDRKEQQIFLDLACFFKGLNLKVDSIKTLLKDNESDNSVAHGLERLKDKALITISEDDVVSMHDIIEEIAWEIVRQESREDIGSQSRLGDADDINKVLENDKGKEVVRSLRMHSSTMRTRKLKLSSHIFVMMSKLQFLDFYSDHNILDSDVLLPKGLKSLPTELRYLRWWHYPLKSLPKKFCVNLLQNLVNLKQVKLYRCASLKELPDFSKATNLEEVNVMHCYDLTDVHPSIFTLDKLEKLELSRCSSLTSLTSNAQLSCLSHVLCNSRSLEELPDFSKATNLLVLDASYCDRLTNVHPSVFSLDKLEKLDLSFCSSLTSLTSNAQLSCLSHLNLQSCSKLTEFSVTSENMVELKLGGTKIKALPPSFGSQRKLEILYLEETIIESLPSCMVNLTRLRYLDLRFCSMLQTIPEFPPSLETLLIQDCSSLKTASFPSTATKQFQENKKRVEFFNCERLDEDSLMAIGLNARINVMKFAQQHLSALKHDFVENYDDYFHNYHSYQSVHVFPGSRVPEWLVYKSTRGSVIIDLFSPPTSPPYGFIFCFIIYEYRVYRTRLKFKVSIRDSAGEDDAGEDEKDSVDVYTSFNYSIFTRDHVCVIYDQRCSRYLSSRSQNLSRFQIKATAWFVVLGEKQRIELKAFGVSLISTSAYDRFVRQKELHDSEGISVH
ncbi:disease resistance-like protein DSC1 isoform X2 [Lotus japonicus]|nr:disease resistance-like protein DSC1 isoform X2 [Lotus japonicus]